MRSDTSSCFVSCRFCRQEPLLRDDDITLSNDSNGSSVSRSCWISWLSLINPETQALHIRTKFWCQHMPPNFGIKWFYSKIILRGRRMCFVSLAQLFHLRSSFLVFVDYHSPCPTNGNQQCSRGIHRTSPFNHAWFLILKVIMETQAVTLWSIPRARKHKNLRTLAEYHCFCHPHSFQQPSVSYQ
jgi:hypothetical protein